MQRILFTFFVILYTITLLNAQLPRLIKNIGPGGLHGINVGWDYPNTFANVSGKLVFWGVDEQHGTELWVTDGTSGGTILIKDIVPGPESPEFIHSYYKQNDRGVYFAIGSNGSRQIWFTDGTVQNTKRLFAEDEIHLLDIYHPIGYNRSAVVFNNLFIMGFVVDEFGLKRCIYRLEPEIELSDPTTAILWKDSLRYFDSHAGILEICEYQGQLIAVAQSATEEGLIHINRDFGYSNWLLKSTGTIYHLSNVNNEFLAFRYPGPEEPFACIRSLNSPALQVLTLPGAFGTPLEDSRVAKIVASKVFFFKDQQYEDLWVSDGTGENTRQAPFQGISRFVGSRNGNSIVVISQDKNTGSFRLISWSGEDSYEILSEDQEILRLNTSNFLEFEERLFVFSENLFVIINGKSYRIFGIPNPGDSTKVNFTFGTEFDNRNLIQNTLILKGWNNTLVESNQIGQEPYLFPLGIKLWTGSESNDWHDPKNWHPQGVPLSSESILIPETPNSHYPVLNQDGACRDLFANFGSITISSNAILKIEGELSNYCLIAGEGKLVMTASTSAIITGPGDFAFSKLEFTSGNFEFKDESKTFSSQIVLSNNTKIFLNDFDLRLNGDLADPITNYSPNSYLVSNGKGSLAIQNISASTNVGSQHIFPMGRSTYNPVTIKYNGSTPATFSVNVLDQAFTNGDKGDPLSVKNINRTWNINREGGDASGADVLLQWHPNDELLNFDRDNCFVRHFSQDRWDNGTPGNALAFSDGYYGREMKNVSTFSPFTVSSDLNALPLKLLSFSASQSEDELQMKWSTEREINVSHFEVEYSKNGIAFIKVGKIGVSNSSTQVRYYEFSHQPQEGKNYYRLKIVDKDGTFFYSKVVSVYFSLSKRIIIFPNPVTTYLNVVSPKGSSIRYLIIRNSGGQVVFARSFNSQLYVHTIDVSGFSKGVYQVEVIQKGKSGKVRFFVKI